MLRMIFVALLVGCTGETWHAGAEDTIFVGFPEGEHTVELTATVRASPAAVPDGPTISQALRIATKFLQPVQVRYIGASEKQARSEKRWANLDLPLQACPARGICEKRARVELTRRDATRELTGEVYADVLVTVPQWSSDQAPEGAIRLSVESDAEVDGPVFHGKRGGQGACGK